MATAPLRFQVLVNGRPVAITGVGTYGVLTAILHWVRRNPAAITEEMRSRPDFDEPTFLNEVCELEMTALDSIKDQHNTWGRQALRPGDEVTIRVLSSGEYDPPKSDA